MSLLMDILLISTAWSHVLLTPFTKVEESFNLHATHDVLMYGVDASSLTNYDHFIFPGAVPRSFLGSVVLAWCSLPAIHLLNGLQSEAIDISSKTDVLIIVRLVLATLNAIGLCVLRRAVSKRFGFSTAAFFTVLSCSQFHLPFWMGRTLPNMFALLPGNYILDRMPNSTRPASQSVTKAISLLTFTAVVFRAEILLLLGPLLLQALLSRSISFSGAVKSGLIAALASIALTTLVDSYFWSKWPLWPELHSLYFNVYQGKSAQWGVSPFYEYFTAHLPKLLLTCAPLAALGLVVEARVRSLLVSPLLFVALISCLGHKEWRFIIYVVPLFNIAAARGAYWMTRQRTRTIFGRLCLLLVLGCIAANVLVTFIMTQASMMNYPGGLALTRFNALFNSTQHVHVHIDNLAAQTGASLFLHVHAPPYPDFLAPPPPPQSNWIWVYNKTERLTAADITAARHFTHAITERADAFPSSEWINVGCVKGFDGFRLGRGRRDDDDDDDAGEGIWERIPRLSIAYVDKLCILSRRDEDV